MWKCGYRYLSSEKLHKICQLVPTLQIREQLVNVWFFSAVSCSFLNASIHFLWTLNYAMTEYRVILLTANFSICRADSAFTSTTAAVLLGKRGLFLQGIVKGATKEFPAKYLDNCQYQRGDHHAATATIEGVPMIALGWKDKTLKRFLSTCGTTVEGQPHTKKRYRVSEDGESSEIFYKTVKRPKLVEEYFDSASKIDVHNHLRQGSLALEEAWGTRK